MQSIKSQTEDARMELEGVPHVSMEQVSLVLVIRERRPKMTWAMLVPRRGTEFPWIAKKAARFIVRLGHNTVTLRCDNEPAIEALARGIGRARQEGSQTVPERPPAGESRSNGIIGRAVGLVAGQARTLTRIEGLLKRRSSRVCATGCGRREDQSCTGRCS